MKVFRPKGVRIAGTGSYLPARVVSNAELVAAGAPLSDEEMVKLSGIRTRHHAAPDEATSDLAVAAARNAIACAGVPAAQIDRLILATVSPDHLSPSAACVAQAALGIAPRPAMDVTASCSGFLYALDLAARAVATGEEAVLAVAADVRSRFLDPADRATCALFGDGAGAAVVARGPDDGTGLIAIGLSADGAGARSVYVPAGGSREPASAETVAGRRHFIRMAEGPQVYLAAVEGMLATAEALLGDLGIGWDAIDLIVPHQPNRRILDRLQRLAGVPADKMVVNVDRIGNVSGATVAIALDEALRAGRASAGSRVLLLAAGAGYTAGAALLVVDSTLASAASRAPGATSARGAT
jgi:3-oxoacyl-[acyl-carrier-protein] synthase-3